MLVKKLNLMTIFAFFMLVITACSGGAPANSLTVELRHAGGLAAPQVLVNQGDILEFSAVVSRGGEAISNPQLTWSFGQSLAQRNPTTTTPNGSTVNGGVVTISKAELINTPIRLNVSATVDDATASTYVELTVQDVIVTLASIFECDHLAQLVASELGVVVSDNIGLSKLASLTELAGWGNGIQSLTGIEYLTSLTSLSLGWGSQISNITPLSSLTNLTTLQLDSSQISDITPLAGLTNLTTLSLATSHWASTQGQISDISALSNLTNIGRLNLSNNQISDISALSNLTNIAGGGFEWGLNEVIGITIGLDLSNNQINDIGVLSNLENVSAGIDLSYNQISDFRPLAEIAGIMLPNDHATCIIDDDVGNGVFARNQTIHLPEVAVGEETPLYLFSSNGEAIDVSGISSNSFTFSDNRLVWQTAGDHSLFFSRGLMTCLGLQFWLFSGTIYQTVTSAPVRLVDIFECEQLALVVAEVLDVDIGDFIELDELATIVNLLGNNRNITSLAGIELLTNLNVLSLSNNRISDLRPLANLDLSVFFVNNQTIDLPTTTVGIETPFPLLRPDGTVVDLLASNGVLDFVNQRLTWQTAGNNSATWFTTVDGVIFSGTVNQQVNEALALTEDFELETDIDVGTDLVPPFLDERPSDYEEVFTIPAEASESLVTLKSASQRRFWQRFNGSS